MTLLSENFHTFAYEYVFYLFLGSLTMSDTEMEGTHFMFRPFNPRFPVEIFLSIIEHDAAIQDLGETPMLIAKAMSAIHLSEMEDGALESLRVCIQLF